MKKCIALLLALLLALACVGCGGEQSGTEGTQGTNGQNTQGSQNKNDGPYEGEVTEAVVRSYKVASEADFAVTEVADGVKITDYLGNDTIVVIPDTIGGKTVVAVESYIFANESPVRGVFIPASVTTLAATFPNNDDLEVVICEGVERITDGAFLKCEKLHAVVLGASLSELGERVFASCKSLKELYIGPALANIEESYARMIFYKCENLTIKGEAGSYIESFCAEYGIPFEAA